MKNAFVILATAVVMLARPASAQTNEPFSQWRIDASLPLQFGTNSLLTQTNSRSDLFVSPSAKLSALGDLDKTTSYSIYAAGNPDAYTRVVTADDGVATFGGRIDQAQILGNFSAGAIYNHSLLFNGLYKSLLFQANDFSGYIGYTYENKAAGFSVVPSFMTTYRLADVAAQDRFLFTLKAAITQALSKSLSITVTPTLRYYDFTDGTAAGKRNTLPSIVGAITYKLNKDVSLSGSIEYDRRWSNRAGNNYEDLVFLASVNFAHAYDFHPNPAH